MVSGPGWLPGPVPERTEQTRVQIPALPLVRSVILDVALSSVSLFPL